MLGFDFADVKPSVFNWIIIGLMAVTFIALMKFLVVHYPNPITNQIKPLVTSV
jgi:hypothetical protein